MTYSDCYSGCCHFQEEASDARVDRARELIREFQRDIGAGRGDAKRSKKAVKALNFWLNYFGDGKGDRVPPSKFHPDHVKILVELMYAE